MLWNIANNVIKLNDLVIPLDIKFDQFREEVKNDIQMLRDSMDSLNHSIRNLSTCLQEHKQQTAVELANLGMSLQEHKQQTQTEMTSLKTSFNSTQVSIDNLTTCLQEHKQQTQAEIMNLQISLNSHQAEHTRQLNNKLDAINSTLNSQIDQSVNSLTTCLQKHRQQTQTEMTSLKTSLNSTQASIDNLNTCLQEHKQQTAVELANLSMSLQEHRQQTETEMINFQTSLNSTQASIDNLTTCLQEYKEQTQTEITSLKTSLNSTQASIDNLTTILQEHKQQTAVELANLQTSLISNQSSQATQILQIHQLNSKLDALNTTLDANYAILNQSVINLTTCLQEHRQQTATELSHLQTSFTSTHSKLDTLTNTTASDHQQIIDSIPDVECMDTQQTVQLHQNLQDNLTHQLETIKDCLNSPSEYTCGGTGGWTRVVYLNMTDPDTSCPSGWQLTGYSKRTCGRVSTGGNICDSATFLVNGGQYNKICGRITAYQYGQPDAFRNTGRSIDQAYACGVSVTHGTPRNHIWTFAAGHSEGDTTTSLSCPCDSTATISIPQFVGNDYFCESGINGPYPAQNIFHPNDPLWDGEDCLPSSTCCSLHNPPYFVKQLPNSITDDIEARICVDDQIQYTNIAVELVELYVQ